MPCETVAPGVIACGPPRGVYHRMIRHCPSCERRRRFVIRWDGAWYGTTFFCACGDQWMDGERMERPLQKGWRKDAQDRFRAMWNNAAPRELFDAYVDADCRFATSDGTEWQQACDDRERAHTAIRNHQNDGA